MHRFERLLEKELICALGCTEPIAIALAGAKAREVLGNEPQEVLIKCSGNIIKNVKGVTVPNTDGMKGIEAAAAIGIVAGDADKGLEVLSGVTDKDIEKARELTESGKMKVVLKEGVENLDIEILLKDAIGNTSEVEIKNKHTNIIKVIKNGECQESRDIREEEKEDLYDGLSVKTIFEFADKGDISGIRNVIERQIKLNEEIAKEGLKGNWGAQIGKLIIDDDTSLRARAKSLAASGSDARMSGCSLPVVINAGSGNQGITCSMPVLVYAREKGRSEEELIRAVILSNLTALHIKRYIGRLSAFCGVASAGAAAGAGIAYLETKDEKTVGKTIANALMIISGMVCDGAKPSCAAKIATAVDAGITGYAMVRNNTNFNPGEGLLKEDIEDTIKSIGYMAREGMKQTDIEILNMMIEK